MEKILEKRIIEEAKKKIAAWHFNESRDYRNFIKSQKKLPLPLIYRSRPKPKLWSQGKHFNPVYCIKHARFLAKSIVNSIRLNKYAPIETIRFSLKKTNGGLREIDIFSIPDTALCTLLSAAMRTRNEKIFSAYSYAYRIGSNPLDAILTLSSFMKAQKVFTSQYDFKDYFGSVDHEYIEKNIIQQNTFRLTRFEKNVISAILKHNYRYIDGRTGVRTVGFPQGNSISLFLANAVGHGLDSSLDKKNGNYIRFADDSVVINYSYEDAIDAIQSYSNFSRDTGVKINRNKESGISILADKIGEMRTNTEISFLGYQISKNRLSLSDKAIRSLKKKCSKIIYKQLILTPKKYGTLSPKRFGKNGTDWDLLGCITELRFMLYGKKSTHNLKRYLEGDSRVKSISSDLSYYCLVDKVDEFSKLDGWLLWALERALEKRKKILKGKLSRPIWPTYSKADLIDGTWVKDQDWGSLRQYIDGSLPSFVLSWRASKKNWKSHGYIGSSKIRNIYSEL